MPLGMVAQVLVISYEMFGMDPMKRGIVNRVRMKSVLQLTTKNLIQFISFVQLISCYMAWALFLSILTELHWICLLCSIQLFSYDYFRVVSLFGITLVDIQIAFFLYYIRIYLKRMPNFNHDFLGSFLTIWTLLMPLILGYVQTYGSNLVVLMVQGFEPIPTILSCILLLMVLVIVVHVLVVFSYHKSTALTAVPQPIYIIEGNNHNQPIGLNNVAYNPTMVNLKATIVMLLPVLLCFILLHLIYHIWLNFDKSEWNFEAIVEYFLRIYACCLSPFLVCIFHKNVRNFAMKIVS